MGKSVLPQSMCLTAKKKRNGKAVLCLFLGMHDGLSLIVGGIMVNLGATEQ